MELHIALAPDLNISSNEFIESWNGKAETSQLATAGQQFSKSPLEAFPIDPQQILIILGGVATVIAVDVIKDTLKEFVGDLLKSKVKQLTPTTRPTIHVEAIRQPGGAVLLVVHEEKMTG